MLVTMKSILDHANKNNYGIMAMNSVNMEMIRGGIEAAEEKSSPLIIQIGPGQMKNLGHKEEIVPMVKELSARVRVPIALNLDHCGDYKIIVDCIKSGFTNVMYDGSSLPYDENLERTKIVCAYAHENNCSVEAELGHVGQAVDNDDHKLDLYTDPQKAKEFVNQTGVDALAVAIGTAHGNYPKDRTPKIDFERLKELKEMLQMPLVLHGGSGSGEDNISKAVSLGINKVNVATDAFAAAKASVLKALEEDGTLDYVHMEMMAEKGVKEFVKHYIDLVRSNNRYTF
ncbi:class II fructose-bisphosphate aldolase [Lactobacillus sp. ESL0791]|uniref:class II fructose-bisphosphate aldolase n=1 Tax=Lactobacillus sp. ESL0791 TaxID=2983234 RepID=UPI0023F6994D|nr:class II fructose-bisphosphate aldolase [Lactobacillus sp. ESL0791]MDF7638285.1 class II fructose-bisphosphate aldolase [Lactobacillus sp. ESL0791]